MEVMHAAGVLGNTIALDSSSSPPSSPPQSPTLSDRECSPSNNGPPVHNLASKQQNGALTVGHIAPTPARAKATGKTKLASDTSTAKKPGRKKKDDSLNPNDPNKPVKEKQKRKPRDPNAPPPQPRKRQKLSTDGTTIKIAATQSAAPATTLTLAQQPLLLPATQPVLLSSSTSENANAAFAQIGKYESEHKTSSPAYGVLQSQPMRQRFDPIRSASAENAALQHASSPPKALLASTPNARASPSIASLIDPPDAYTASRHFHTPSLLASSTTAETGTRTPPASASLNGTKSILLHDDDDTSTGLPSPAVQPAISGQTIPVRGSKPISSSKPLKAETPPGAPSPKPTRQKEAPPPLPLGSGLLSSSAFGGKSEPVKKQYAEVPNECIIIEVPITQETGNYVNFMREVENKYGFDVAHPRLAEHRRRMAQMAAAGAALEPGIEGEDMRMDDSDADSNVEMGGVAEDESTAAEGKKKKRRMKANEYDKADDFIDDTEQMWEEQAMASNNGYFVWSGPLVTEPPKTSDDKPDGSASRRGRGRGRGGATRGETSGRGRGRGGRAARGDGTTRKPRITKAERAKLETEKQERENYAATAQKAALQADTDL